MLFIRYNHTICFRNFISKETGRLLKSAGKKIRFNG